MGGLVICDNESVLRFVKTIDMYYNILYDSNIIYKILHQIRQTRRDCEAVMEKYSDGFVRNCFINGMLLSADDLTNLQNYFDGKRRISYKELVGYGVVFGLTVEASGNKITVNPGLAIDTHGREIYVPSSLSVLANSLFTENPKSGKYYLHIEYAEEACGEAFIISEDKLKETVNNRTRETFKLTVNSSLNNQKICIAGIIVEACADIVQISGIELPPVSFHLAPVWKQFLPRHKSGLVYIDKDDIPDENGVFRTQEIPHGLGCGKNITMELSVKYYDRWRECEIFGDRQLFDAPIQLAAKLFPATGTFIIAVKPQVSVRLPVCVRWHAYTAQEDTAHE